jgi:hypothetical protein
MRRNLSQYIDRHSSLLLRLCEWLRMRNGLIGVFVPLRCHEPYFKLNIQHSTHVRIASQGKASVNTVFFAFRTEALVG